MLSVTDGPAANPPGIESAESPGAVPTACPKKPKPQKTAGNPSGDREGWGVAGGPACPGARPPCRKGPQVFPVGEVMGAWRALGVKCGCLSPIQSKTGTCDLHIPTTVRPKSAFWLGVCATLVGLREPQFGTFLLGVPLGLGAVVLGIIGLVRARRDGGLSLAVTGVVLGLVGPFAALAGWVLIIGIPY